MDFILGLLGLLQIIFIPGLIVYRFFSLRTNLLDKLLIIFATSLITNYCALFLLSSMGLYTRTTLGLLILGELAVILWLYRRNLVTPVQAILEAGQDAIYGTVNLFLPKRQQDGGSVPYYFVVLILLLLSAGSILWGVNLFLQNLGSVFSAWDAVVSWNHWATIWAAGRIPMDTHFYPQLLPANWSITYVLPGSTVIQFFAKGIMPLFTVMMLLGLFNLVLLTGKFHFLVSIVLLQILLSNFLKSGLTSGYVDVAVAFFAFAALYMLVKAHITSDLKQRGQLYLLGALFSAGAAVAKQSGVYMALCYPVLVYADVVFSKVAVEKKQLRTWIMSFALVSLIWISWYLLKEVRILTGMDYANIDTLVNLSADKYENSSLVQQVSAAIGQYSEFVILFLLVAVVFPWMDRFYKVLTLLFAPYPLIWAWMASYDTRNLALFLPVLAIVAGCAIDRLLLQLVQVSERAGVTRIPIAVPLAFAGAALIGLNFIATPQKLERRQVDLQRQIFSPKKNQMLLDLVAENGPQTRIMTNYPMEYIPGLGEYQVRFDYQDYDTFLAKLRDSDVEYLLVPNATDDQIKDYIEEKVQTGEYQVVSRDKQWKVFTLIKILERE